MDDRISKLPEEILVSILSLLSLTEAAKTSVLSSRWRYLWTYFNGKVHFYEYDWYISDWYELVDMINGILKLLRSPRLESFEVVFGGVYSVEAIYPWIEFVAKKDVKSFHLRLGSPVTRSLPFRSLPWTLSAMPYLSFGSLEKLCLSNVDVGNATVQHILSNSPNLELVVFFALFSLSRLSIPTSLTKLKELSLLACCNLKNVSISSRSLEELTIEGPYGRLDIDAKIALRLHTFHIGNSLHKSVSQLINRLCRDKIPLGQLQKLLLDFQDMEEYGVTAAVKHVKFPILKHLILVINPEGGNKMLNCINYLLAAAPVLHTLEIRLAWKCLESKILYEKIVQNPNLPIKVLTVSNFLGNKIDIMIVKNLIESSASLQKLIINPYKEEAFPYLTGANTRANKRIKDLCEDGFLSKRYLSSRIELVIE